MTPIRDEFDRPPRPPRVGRIRGGVYDEKGGHPKATDTIVLTSDNEIWLERLRQDYGGKVEKYVPQGQSESIYRLITETDHLMVLLPSPVVDENFEDWYELWETGGLARRCDGIDCVAAEWDPVEENVAYLPHECLCKAEGGKRRCQVMWRLSVWIPSTALGIWQLQSSSKYGRVQIDGGLRLLESTFPDMISRVPVRLAYTPQQISYPDAKAKKRKRGTKRIWTLGLAVPVMEATHILRSGNAAELLSRSVKALPSGDGHEQGSDDPASGRAVPRDSGEVGSTGRTGPEGSASSDLSGWEVYQAAEKRAMAEFGLTQIQLRKHHVMAWWKDQGTKGTALGFPPRKDWPEDALRSAAADLDARVNAGRQGAMSV